MGDFIKKMYRISFLGLVIYILLGAAVSFICAAIAMKESGFEPTKFFYTVFIQLMDYTEKIYAVVIVAVALFSKKKSAVRPLVLLIVFAVCKIFGHSVSLLFARFTANFMGYYVIEWISYYNKIIVYEKMFSNLISFIYSVSSMLLVMTLAVELAAEIKKSAEQIRRIVRLLLIIALSVASVGLLICIVMILRNSASNINSGLVYHTDKDVFVSIMNVSITFVPVILLALFGLYSKKMHSSAGMRYFIIPPAVMILQKLLLLEDYMICSMLNISPYTYFNQVFISFADYSVLIVATAFGMAFSAMNFEKTGVQYEKT